MRITCVIPWKLTGAPARNWAGDLLKRIERTSPIQMVAPQKTLDGERAIEQFLVRECEKIIQDQGLIYFLDERGKNPSSEQFADDIRALRDRGIRHLGFVLGGAYGLPSGLRPFLKSGRLLSLSQSTFAHELSLVVLLEQIYRAECIRANHPYHHGGASPLAEIMQSPASGRH